jgi:hypothetical protein
MDTYTFSPTWTPTDTATPSITNTPTSTATPTITSTPIPTVYVFSPEGFEESSFPPGWTTISVNGQAYMLLSTAEAHTGNQSIKIWDSFSMTGEEFTFKDVFTPQVNLTGKTISFWYFLDNYPSSNGGYVDMFYHTPSGVSHNNLTATTGVWTQITFPISDGDSTSVSEVGISLMPAGGTGNSVNFYIDDVTIQ